MITYIHVFLLYSYRALRYLPSFPTRRSSDLPAVVVLGALEHQMLEEVREAGVPWPFVLGSDVIPDVDRDDRTPVRFVQQRSEEHTSELQSLRHLVCRLLLEKKKVQYLTLDLV